MWEAGPSKPGIWFLDVESYQQHHIDEIRALVAEAKEKHQVDLVLFSLHWGSNYCWIPSKKFQQFAHQLVDDCSVDIIHGHSSHHVQVFSYVVRNAQLLLLLLYVGYRNIQGQADTVWLWGFRRQVNMFLIGALIDVN
jgi:hypothetical protein